MGLSYWGIFISSGGKSKVTSLFIGFFCASTHRGFHRPEGSYGVSFVHDASFHGRPSGPADGYFVFGQKHRIWKVIARTGVAALMNRQICWCNYGIFSDL